MSEHSNRFMIPALAAILLCAAPEAVVAQGDDVQIHVFVSQGAAKSTSTNDFVMSGTGEGTFQFNEFGVNLQQRVSSRLRVGVQLFAQARGDYGRDKPTIDWAIGDYRFKDWAGVRIGKVKMPLGLYNESRDADSLRTFVMLPQGTYDDRSRESTIAQTGAALYGTVPMRAAGQLAYQLHTGALAMAPDGGVAKNIEMALPVNVTDADGGTTYVANLEWRAPLEGLRLATTWLSTRFTVQATTTAAAGNLGLPTGISLPVEFDKVTRSYVSAEYTFRNLVLAAEYRRETIRASVGGRLSRHQDNDSAYVSGTYRINRFLEVGSYYEGYYLNRFERNAPGTFRKDLAAALRVDVNKYWVVKVEAHRLHGTAGMLPATPGPLAEHSYFFAAKATFGF